MVANAFLDEKPPEATCILHLDYNPMNNAAVNLQWGTGHIQFLIKKLHKNELRGEGKLKDDQPLLSSQEIYETNVDIRELTDFLLYDHIREREAYEDDTFAKYRSVARKRNF